MKCVAIKGERKFEIKEIAEPQKEDGKVLIDVKKTGICGSDLHYFEIGMPVGLIMGHEYCGVVVDNGGREDLKVGDRVTALPISPCGYCEACLSGNIHYCLETWDHASGLSLDNPGGLAPRLKVRSDMVLKIPDNMSDEEGALVEPTAVGYHAINLADVKVGDQVLVVGGGIIGLVSAMFSKKSGASKVVVSETNPKRGELAIKLGAADEWLNALDKEEMEKHNNAFDKVIECCGNTPAVNSAVSLVKPGGTVILVGVSMSPINFASVSAVMKEAHLIGAIAYTKEEFAKCIDMIANKEIDVLKFVTKRIGLDDVQNAYEDLTSGSSNEIKIMVDPNK